MPASLILSLVPLETVDTDAVCCSNKEKTKLRTKVDTSGKSLSLHVTYQKGTAVPLRLARLLKLRRGEISKAEGLLFSFLIQERPGVICTNTVTRAGQS